MLAQTGGVEKLKVSVITPSFNDGATIARAINSVMTQDYTEWEHIIVDGGSTDDSIKTIQNYAHLKWISEPDGGQADAMNKGFLRSSGDIIVYLNADDYFLPGAFSSVIGAFDDGAVFVVGNVLISSDRIGTQYLNKPRVDLEGMLRHWEPNSFCYNPVGYFYRRVVQERCPLNLENNSSMDLEFLLAAVTLYKFTKIEKTLGCYMDGLDTKTHKSQIDSSYWRPETFAYLDKYIEALPQKKRITFRADQKAGYAKIETYWQRMERNRFKTAFTIRNSIVKWYRKFC